MSDQVRVDGRSASLGTPTDTPRQRAAPCSLCDDQEEPTAIARVALGVLIAITDGRWDDGRLLLRGHCDSHTRTVVGTTVAVLRLLDATFDELEDLGHDPDTLRRDLPRQIAYALAQPRTERNPS